MMIHWKSAAGVAHKLQQSMKQLQQSMQQPLWDESAAGLGHKLQQSMQHMKQIMARLKLTKDKGEEERNNHVRHEQMKAQRHASHAGVIVHYVFTA